MKRRQLLAAVVASALPLHARGQQPTKRFRIGFLTGGSEVASQPLLAAFARGLRDLGYDDQALIIIARYAEGKFERLPAFARQLLDLNPDVLLVATTPANLAMKAANPGVPTVMVAVGDPLGAGLVASLARPGGNITGVTNVLSELTAKRLEIVRELVPGTTRVAVVLNSEDPVTALQMRELQQGASRLGVAIEPVLEIRGADDLEPAFAAASRAGAQAALRLVDPLAGALAKPTAIAAAKYRVPTMYGGREAVDAGGLISYGASQADQYRQAAAYVHRILQGAQPADLPIARPTKFELVINQKAARALGLAVPPVLLAQADEVIQ